MVCDRAFVFQMCILYGLTISVETRSSSNIKVNTKKEMAIMGY